MSSPIGEIDLHAYVDGQLDAARRAEVEAYVAAHSEAASTVHALRLQNLALHRHYDGVLNEPVPLRLTHALRPWHRPRAMAAGLVWLACGLAAGWFARAWMSAPVGPTVFAQKALAAHVLYVAEKRHPVEVPGAQEAHLVAWLSKRLDAPIRAPDLQQQGFSLLGGRLLPGDENAPLAQLMYEAASGERLTLTVKHAPRSQPETGFKLLERDGNSVFYWIDRDYGYALSGNIGKQRMLAVAHAIDAQLRR
ncbi:anti-sigma factor [Noviherbaspirillum sp. UKPF54]|uniref:anti-sigma factor family protein n=1 Tax=Noviherbaspirillum sp. UKPF54 TaxID=2601898 RepID=UPI0011B14EA7|nr:anti-sigma factor [Noviherbaspirillum sp. UKPF54]QDZ30181.1 anti-sigma factor [Noviherbaspirillum sp. UKPF54]